jgi:hypothetical protein
MSGNAKIVLGAVLIALFVVSGVATHSFASLRGVGVLIAVWATLAILSFLYKDNPLYRLTEHIMVGLAMGYFAIYYLFQILEDQWWDKLVRGNLRPGEELFGNPLAFRYALIIPAIAGALMLTRVIPKIGYFSRWSMAMLIGLTGLGIPWTVQTRITTQLLSGTELPMQYMEAFRGVEQSFVDVYAWQIGVPVLIIGTICALIYFFFSIPHRGVIGQAATVGIWVLMVGFGASFGLTVMARLSLFIGRVLFVFKNWLGILGT